MTISIQSLKGFDGPNIWSSAPVTHFEIGLGSPGAAVRPPRALADWLTGFLHAGFVDPIFLLDPQTPVPFAFDCGTADLVGTLTLNLQRLASFPVTFLAIRPIAERTHEVVVEHDDDLVGAAAARLAVHVVDRLSSADPTPTGAFKTDLSRFGMLAASRRLALDARPIVVTARRRGVPVSRVDPSGRIIELGNGRYRKRILGSITSRTSVIGESISENKHLTNHYLRAAGLPVPDGAMARTIEQALTVAHDLGYPVVVKPVDAAGAAAVAIDVRDHDGIREAFGPAAAASPTSSVLVERFIAGNEYRAFVVNNQIVAVTQRVPAHVVGDGAHTVRHLVGLANADPRRGKHESAPLREIVVDSSAINALRRQDLDLDSIPEAGRFVKLKPHGQLQGNWHVDRTDVVHPDNVAIICQAVRLLDLDVATVDLVAYDITESIWTTSGAIIEINTRSGFKPIVYPSTGQPRDPGPVIVDGLFPPNRPARVTIIAVTGDAPTSSAISKVLAHILTTGGDVVGLATADGLLVAGRPVHSANPLHPTGVRTLLNNPSTEVVVKVVDPRSTVDHGLGFDYCDIAVITALSGLTRPNGQPVETVLTDLIGSSGVLVINADDPGATSLVRDRGESAVFFCLNAESAGLRAHLAHDGRAVVLRQTMSGLMISLLTRSGPVDIAPAFTHSLAAGLPHPLASHAMLAAVSAAVARGVPIEAIRRNLS